MQKTQMQSAMQIMDDVMKQLEESFFGLGLTEEQENMLLHVVQSGVNRSLDNVEQSLNIDEQLRAIVHRLEGVSQR